MCTFERAFHITSVMAQEERNWERERESVKKIMHGIRSSILNPNNSAPPVMNIMADVHHALSVLSTVPLTYFINPVHI